MLSFICSLQEQKLIRRRSGNRTGIDCAGGEDEGSGEPRSRRGSHILCFVSNRLKYKLLNLNQTYLAFGGVDKQKPWLDLLMYLGDYFFFY